MAKYLTLRAGDVLMTDRYGLVEFLGLGADRDEVDVKVLDKGFEKDPLVTIDRGSISRCYRETWKRTASHRLSPGTATSVVGGGGRNTLRQVHDGTHPWQRARYGSDRDAMSEPVGPGGT